MMHRISGAIRVLFTCVALVLVLLVALSSAYFILEWSRADSAKGPPDLERVELPVVQSSALYGEILREVSDSGNVIVEELQSELQYWREVNPDVCAIVDIPEYNLHEPVVNATESNKQWLRTNITGEYDVAGCVFLDVRSDIEISPLKLVHGHNMKDGSMFANVPNYLKLQSCVDAPKIYWTTDSGTAAYSVFAVLSVNSKEEALPIDLLDSYEDLDLILKDLQERSLVPGGVINGQDCLLLNTCWYGESGTERNLHCIIVASREGFYTDEYVNAFQGTGAG